MDGQHPETRPDQPNYTRERAKQLAIKGLAAIGLIALLALGTWGTVQLVRNSPALWSGLGAAVSTVTSRLFPADEPVLALSLENYSVQSDEPFTLSWNVENAPDSATYAFVYECADALTFLTPNESGGNARIACGEAYRFSSDAASLTLTPVSPDHRFLDATVKLMLLTQDQIAAEDDALVTVVNDRLSTGGTNATSTATTTPPQPPADRTATPPPTYYYPVYTTVTVPAYSDPNGFVDLQIEILEAGVLDRRSSDSFESSRNELDRDELAGVRFVVTNAGTKTSDEWTFEAELPTKPSETYRPRDEQQALAPGDRMEITLAFDQLSSRDEDEIEIEVDPRDRIDESNERNNRDSLEVEIED